jgi:hypothetical protein
MIRTEFLQPWGITTSSTEMVISLWSSFTLEKDHARTEMGAVAEDRVADVVEVRDLRFVEDDRILELAGVPRTHPEPT